MGTFQFRLEKVWKHRRSIVDKHSLEVARVNRKVSTLSQRIVKIDGDIHLQSFSMVRAGGQEMNSHALTVETTWLNHLHQMRDELYQELRTSLQDLERHRSRLADSWRDLEVLSRLKDRKAEVWQTDQNKRQRREMDEIGQIRAFRPWGTKDSP
jgi:flagellar export protein FliJ